MRSKIFLVVLLFCFSCKKNETENHSKVSIDTKTKSIDSFFLKHDTFSKTSKVSINKDSEYKIPDTLKLKQIFGYRFVIYGDFDGDKIKDTIYESVTSKGKEVNKFYENVEINDLIAITIKRKLQIYLKSKSKKIKPFLASNITQNFGIAFLKNEGDLNGDGNDEISYVVDYADNSSVNTMRILTYKNNNWKELYSFEIRDWLLPQTPISNNIYGMFGVEGKIHETSKKQNDTILKAFKEFLGLIKKLKNNKAKIWYMNSEVELDSMIVKIKK